MITRRSITTLDAANALCLWKLSTPVFIMCGVPRGLRSSLCVGAFLAGRSQLVNANAFFTPLVARAVRPSAAREPPAPGKSI